MIQWLQRLFSGSARARHAMSGAPLAASSVPAVSAKASASNPVRAGVTFEQKDNLNASYYNWLFEARDESGLDNSPLETAVLDALDKTVKLQQPADLVRRLPGLIPQLLQSLRSDTFSGTQLAKKISHDVVLVAAVIRLANSAFLGTGKSIGSVEHAVIVIGQEGLRQLITSVAFRPIIDMNSGHFTRLLAPRIWNQSERCAIANRTLAVAMNVDPFEAFLAGLVQYVGLIVSLRMMDQLAKDNKDLGSAMFCASLVRNARVLSCSIGREWNFPAAVTTAIEDQASMQKGAGMSPLGRLLSLGDYLSKVNVLVEHQHLTGDNTHVFRGLSAEALACYQSLDMQSSGNP